MKLSNRSNALRQVLMVDVRHRHTGAWTFAVAACLVLACVGASVSVATGTSSAPSRGVPGLVVSAARNHRLANLFLLGTGGRLRRLSAIDKHQVEPAFSPNGTKIAYVQTSRPSCQTCPWSLWLMNANGSDRHLLTPQPYLSNPTTYDTNPSWSPDGSQIIFSRSTNDSYELYTVPATGGIPRDLYVAGASPAWGPSRIAYVSLPFERPGPVVLWTANPDGTNARQLTVGYIESPTWSRSGTLAYLNQPPVGGPTLVVYSGGAHRYRLPFAQATSLSWAPNNHSLAVVARATPSSPYDVYSINLDGTGLRRLTTNLDALGGASWGG